MSKAAEARFNAADNDRNISVDITDTFTVNINGTIGSLPALAAGRVGVFASRFLCTRVMIHHGIHVSGIHKKAKPGFAENFERFSTFPIGLSNYSDRITV